MAAQSMDEPPMVSFVIVSWNAKAYLRRCLESLSRHGCDVATEVIVVDNASADGSPEMVIADFPNAKLIQTGANVGFAKGNNIGIRATQGRHLCLLNSDVEVFPETVPALVAIMERNREIGLIAPQALNTDGSPQGNCRREPNLWNSVCRALSLDTLFPNSSFAEGLKLTTSSSDPIQVDVLTGCFWLIRREAMESIRELDEQFFMYGEDLDLCKRLRNAKWQVVYAPGERIIHHGGASSADAPSRFFIELNRAQLQYWRKHFSPTATFIFLVTLWAHNISRLTGYIFAWALFASHRRSYRIKIDRSWQCLKWLARTGVGYSQARDAHSVESDLPMSTKTTSPSPKAVGALGLEP
jgi:GT2 family glycosyltransferase